MATFYEFYSAHHAHLINVDDVRSARVRKREGSGELFETVIEFKDGTERVLPGQNHLKFISRMSGPVFPATPGFFVLTFHYTDETPSAAAVLDDLNLNREPILAWRCGPHGAEPIVIEGQDDPADNAGDSVILYPSGRVLSSHDREWPSIDAWAKDVCEQWTEWREKRKAVA